MSRRDWDAIRPDPRVGIGRPTARAVSIIRRFVGPVVRLCFRPRIEGLERLPDGPFLLVANHSAGLGLAEILSFAWLYLDRIGPERPLTALAHPIGFQMWPADEMHRQIGTIPSTYAAAAEALAEGVPILVFPGGGYETQRPFWQANRVDFNRRRGYVRIARRAGVPIVPMAIRGSHWTAPILLRSRLLAHLLILPARLMGEKRWALSLLGVLVAALLLTSDLWWPLRLGLTFVWLGTPLIYLPIVPAPISFHIGPPVSFDDLSGPHGDDIDEMGERVEATLQALLTDRAVTARRDPPAPAR